MKGEIERIAEENHYSGELIYQVYTEMFMEDGNPNALGEVERMAKEQDLDECYLKVCATRYLG